FKIWANNILKQRSLAIHNDIMDDLSDGILLINLMEILTNRKCEGNHSSKPTNRFQKISNVQLALSAIERYGIRLINLSADNIVDRHKMTLSLIWRIIQKFHIQQFMSDEDLEPDIDDFGGGSGGNAAPRARENIYKTTRGMPSTSNKTPREALLRWCRRELESYTLNTPITNFTKCFQNPQVFYALVHHQAPTAITLNELNELDEVAGLKKCFEVAERVLGIPSMLQPQSIIDGQLDESCIMTYVAYFLNFQRTGPSGPVTQHHRGHNRASSTGSNTSTSSAASFTSPSGGMYNTLASSDGKFKRPPLKRQDTSSTSDKMSIFTLASPPTSPSSNNNNINSLLPHSVMTPPTSPGSDYSSISSLKTTATQPPSSSSSSSSSAAAIASVMASLKQDLLRVTGNHEAALNKTASRLDQSVNVVGEKLQQLEKKVITFKQGMNNNTNNPTPITTPPLSAVVGSPASSGASPAAAATSPPTVAVPKASKKKDRNGETKEERELRREHRRSRRKHREEKKREKEMLGSAATLTMSSSSCSLLSHEEVHHMDREDQRKVVKVQAVVRGYLARRQYKRIKNRRDVAMELLTTERSYINSLQILAQEYLTPLRKMSEQLNITTNVDNLKSLSDNIAVITNINTSLLNLFKQRIESKPWHCHTLFGDIFFKLSDLLRCYISYVNQYNRSLNSVNEFMKHSALSDYITATTLRTNQRLNDLIIIPVQRIPRYVLLLEQMAKVTEASHPDRAQLVQGLAKVQSIADYVNEKKRDFENVIHVSILQESITGFNIMDYPSLRYILEGDLQIYMPSSGSGYTKGGNSMMGGSSSGSSQDKEMKGAPVATIFHVFLFNQMLVICKYKKGKESYFLSNKHLFTSSNDRKSKQPKYKFIFKQSLTCDTTLSHNKSESWFSVDNQQDFKKFIAKTVAEKDMWIQHIQSCITKATENKKSKVNTSSGSL
ncbi:hypothetical protein SAMD00019534_110620, partial [Acytostelium subglobosum LB1]|uniref:hypothetical protein n=1 Tax=Acytostelium subglobosum LB1 TaxID=1410327 RepID=UPI000644B5E3